MNRYEVLEIVASSTTKSAIAPGEIEVTKDKDFDINKINRDTKNSLNKLGQIFDKKLVQEKQELAKLFGQVAYKEVHRIAEAQGWAEGSKEKIALHALVGGAMSTVGDGSFLAGAVGLLN